MDKFFQFKNMFSSIEIYKLWIFDGLVTLFVEFRILEQEQTLFECTQAFCIFNFRLLYFLRYLGYLSYHHYNILYNFMEQQIIFKGLIILSYCRINKQSFIQKQSAKKIKVKRLFMTIWNCMVEVKKVEEIFFIFFLRCFANMNKVTINKNICFYYLFQLIFINIFVIYQIPRMQIFIHSLDGHQEIVNVAQGLTISQLKEMIIGHSNIQLVCNGMILSSLALLEPYSNVYVSAALEGGKKKKKKKAYTTKKKNKHIHKKVKLHTLSLYGVDNKGAVTYSRKTCPNCGPGIFMGKHWDRYYCGTCHTTIKMDAETIRQNQQILKKKRAALEAQKKAKEKELADKAPAAKGGKKDAKAGKKGKK